MLKKYGELIGKLLDNLFNGSTEVSLTECLKIMGSGILLMLILLLLVTIVVGVVFFPTKVYGFMVKSVKQKLNTAIAENLIDADGNPVKDALYKSLLFRRVIFFILFVVIYLPVSIPAVLYLVSLLIH